MAAFFIFYHVLQCARKMAHLKETDTDGQINSRRKDKYNQRHAPNLVVNPF